MSIRTRNKVVVGISSRSSEKDLHWLMEFIRETFWELVSDVKYLPITNHNFLEWKEDMRRCSVGILYHTKRQGRINIVDVDGALYDEELQSLSNYLGKSKVLVVLDDLEKCSDSERERILDAQSSLKHLSSQLLLFPEKGKLEEAKKMKAEFLKFLGNNAGAQDLQVNTKEPEGGRKWEMNQLPGVAFFSSILSRQNSAEASSDSTQNCSSKNVAKFRNPIKSRLRISIFSRSAQSNYKWLMEWLKTKCMMRPIDVRAVCITNRFTSFHSELPNCSFAILYHTQNQGRLNITDVTDSLYNEELRELSNFLGRENVIVVVDDLKNTDITEKKRILRNQPSIDKLAQDLYLFNSKKNNIENLESIKRIIMEKMEKAQDNEGWTMIATDDSGRKPNGSMSTWGLRQKEFPDSSVDNEPASSKSTEEPHLSDARPWKGADHLEGPDAKKIILDPSELTLHAAQVDSAFQDVFCMFSLVHDKIHIANVKWQDHLNAAQAQFKEMSQEIEKLQRKNEELQSQKRSLVKEMSDTQKQVVEAHKIIKEQEHRVEKLHKDLHDKDRTIEQKRGRIQNMEQNIEELLKELRDKGLQIDETQTRRDTPLAIEKLHKDLRDKDWTVEKERGRIQNMEQEMENKPDQEMQTRESQRYEERSPVPGEEDKMTSKMMDEGSLLGTTEWNIDFRYNPQERSREIQSLASGDDLIEQLKRTMRQKDEEIQRLKVKVLQQESDLKTHL